MFALRKYVKINRCSFHDGIIRWQIFQYIKVVPGIIALTLTFSEILTFTIYDLQKVGQGHEVKFRIDNIRKKMSKSTQDTNTFFTPALTVSVITTVKHFILTFKRWVKVTKYNCCNDKVRWHVSKSAQDFHIFLR